MALGQIEKQFGKGSVMKMGDKTTMAIESVPTGALALALALGIGGLPRGRITEIYGPESSGKTTLATHVVAEAQRNGGTCAYIDAEHAMDPVYAKAIGVDIDELLISQPDTGEQALEIADMLIRSGALDVVGGRRGFHRRVERVGRARRHGRQECAARLCLLSVREWRRARAPAALRLRNLPAAASPSPISGCSAFASSLP